jgi:chemotaxis protein CheD
MIRKFILPGQYYISNTIMKRDSDPGHYRAQIFGGAKVIKTNSIENDISLKNIDIARKILTAQGIRIIRKEVGGTRGRRIRFDTVTNTVFCRFAGQIRSKTARRRHLSSNFT